jgi:hypothetical protein
MSNDSSPESESGTESGRPPADEPATTGVDNAQTSNHAAEAPSRAVASVLGAQAAFQLDATILAQLQNQTETSLRFSPESLARMQTVADSLARVAVPPESLERMARAVAAIEEVAVPPETLERMARMVATVGEFAVPPETLANFQASLAAANLKLFPEDYWEQFRVTARLLSESVSIPALYSPDQLALRGRGHGSNPRESRSAEAFFDEHSVDITDVRSLLKALAVIQTKHHKHRLIWRGQQNAAWPVHSSLYRKLEASERPSEDRLISAEKTSMTHAQKWGERPTPALEFFADLQHRGAPTRLLDGTLEPEVATWFAIEAHPEHDEEDGRVFAWGRTVRTKARTVSETNDALPAGEDAPFWHSWTTDDERGRVGWGTGSRTWSWFPPALSDRMRAQRAGVLSRSRAARYPECGKGDF